MSQELKREYLNAIRERYQKSPRVRKSMILEEFIAVCGYSRKYAIRILNGPNWLTQKGTGDSRSGEFGSLLARQGARRVFSGLLVRQSVFLDWV